MMRLVKHVSLPRLLVDFLEDFKVRMGMAGWNS